MLNIGKLSPGAAEYYIGEVATAVEDYYTGQGESPGRWIGSLREVLGVEDDVEADHFRRVLAGDHPISGATLVSAQGSSERAAAKAGVERSGQLEGVVDSARAAAYLGVSHQHVRRLLKAGAEYQAALEAATEADVVPEPRSYLVGELVLRAGKTGTDAWRITGAEILRFESVRTPRKYRPGYDVTLRPPKSVSVLWALSPSDVREAIRDAHSDAVDEVVHYLEHWAVRARATESKRQVEVETDGVIAAAFDHRTSRAGDPLLHTHVVVANMTRVDTKTGPVWRTIAARGLFEHAKAAGFLYQAHLRRGLTERLGLDWGPVVNGYADVQGVPEHVIEMFSKRSVEIAEVLAESGSTSARAAQIATLESRRPKDYQVDPDALFDRWRTDASKAGFGRRELRATIGKARIEELSPERVAELMIELAGPSGVTARASVFRRSDVIEAVASRVGAACTAREVEGLADRFIASADCVVVDSISGNKDGAPSSAPTRRGSMQTLYTTAELADMESYVLDAANDRSAIEISPLEEEVVHRVVHSRPELSPEQQAMVHSLCSLDAVVVPVAGRPGAGKTYATEAVVAAYAEAGVPIVGCAVSATAAAELESAAGFARSTMPATTVAGLLIDLDRWGGLASGSVVVVDEASMLGTRDLYRLVSHAQRAGGAVVLIGDPDQHGSVDVGGAFQRFCRDRGEHLIRLEDNNRQQDHTERLAIDEYRDGHIVEALSRMDNTGRVVRSATAGESFDAMVSDWYADHIEGRADPMIAGPNSTRRALNDRARVLLKEHGELSGTPIVVAGREFMVGDLVVARLNDKRLRPEPGGQFVKNGSTGTVIGIDAQRKELTVRFDQEGEIAIPHTYLVGGHLEHGYARTSYGVQGATHGTARYHPTDLSSFEEGYVAITRGRDANRVYIVDGTIANTDDQTHQRPESTRFDLDDITQALGRRRAGAMAADLAPDLATVHSLATSRTLAELNDARRRLAARLGEAPPDATTAIDRLRIDLEDLTTRRRLWVAADKPAAQVAHLDEAIARTERRLSAAVGQQAEHEAWIEANEALIDRHSAVTRAIRHRRSRIAATPTLYLSAEAIEAAGPEPMNQQQRRAWRDGLVEAAISLDSAPPQVSLDEDVPALPEFG